MMVIKMIIAVIIYTIKRRKIKQCGKNDVKIIHNQTNIRRNTLLKIKTIIIVKVKIDIKIKMRIQIKFFLPVNNSIRIALRPRKIIQRMFCSRRIKKR